MNFNHKWSAVLGENMKTLFIFNSTEVTYVDCLLNVQQT